MNDANQSDGEPRPAAVRLAYEIKARREKAGLSQPRLGVAIGYTRQYVSLAERPGQNLPSFELVKAIDKALEADGTLIALRQAAKREQQTVRGDADSKPPVEAPADRRSQAGSPLSGLSPAQIPDLVDHLREQWHLLVKTDNLFGPRFALGPVHDHLRLLQELMRTARAPVRREMVRLAAQYAESAAWLHEDAGEALLAQHWTDRAMEWAHEADDRLMLAWTLFRRSQQAAAACDPARTVALAEAARRDEAALPTPMKAAIAQQEAHGHALDGDPNTAQHKLDEAHTWAAADTTGDARAGHGSFCTATYLELQRAACWLTVGQPARAIRVYEMVLPSLAPAYRRDRGTALSRFATAAARIGEPEYAAHLADEALDIAHSSGSVRTENELRTVALLLAPHRTIAAVAAFDHKLAMNTSP
ncbi:helix-turn-helix transcriptional regulator [Actinosynnema sp. CS-041913]|uniref:helix-turn-helix transcriptional regulator n=1 Tax=Actinosynnema sp. CS-041913 TaxID=3239917 RepID=UPI003D89E7AD